MPHTYLWEHLKKQRQEDITRLVKPKEVMFCGRSNIGKSSLINTIFEAEVCRKSKHAGCTKTLNYYQLQSATDERYVVDSPGYGYLGMKRESGEKLRKMIALYSRDSSRLCKVFLLLDLQKGLTDDDLDFFEQCKDLRMGFELVFSRADRLDPRHWTARALAIGNQLRKYSDIINPVSHIVSSE